MRVCGFLCCLPQALDRLTSFKSRLRKRIWRDHRKIDWHEEDVHLQRASKELTKAIQVQYNSGSSIVPVE